MVGVKLLDIEWIIINYDCICIVSKLFMGIKVCVKKDLKGKIIFDNIWIKNDFFFEICIWNIYFELLLLDVFVKNLIFWN